VLEASKTITLVPPTTPATYVDGNATFSPESRFQIPSVIPVVQGNSAHGRVLLTLTSSISFPSTCTYEGYQPLPLDLETETIANPGDRYVFLDCWGGHLPGEALG
jgi:hypothetical protein